MTDTVMIALISGATTTLGAAITAIVAIRNGRKVDAVKDQTNGHLSKLTEELKAANATIAGMHKTIEKIAPTNR